MEKETEVWMRTNLGDIRLKLYNDTPLHRDNFLKLVDDGTYNGLLFHRVIREFMVQGGDVTSKDAPMNKQLGAGDLGYTVPAEFVYPKHFHKRGALCAARTGDEVNPERASSASQFYIVTGKKYSDSELKQMEKQLENRLKQSIFARLQTENKAKIMELYRSGDKEGLAILRDTLIGKTELEAERRRDEAKLTVVRIEFEPITTLGSVNRHFVGVREEGIIRWHPGTMKMSFTPPDDGYLSTHSGYALHQAPLERSESGISTRCNDVDFILDVSVVEPTEIVACGRPTQNTFGLGHNVAGGIGMGLQLYVMPTNVAFSGIAVQEVPTDYRDPTGYFANPYFDTVWSHTVERHAGEWHNIAASNFFHGGQCGHGGDAAPNEAGRNDNRRFAVRMDEWNDELEDPRWVE